MADPKEKDPLAMWRDMLSQWETNVNALANRTMKSDEYSSSMHGAMGMSLRMQEAIRDFMAAYLATTNLPSRTEVLALGERIGGIEARLDRMNAPVITLGSPFSRSPHASNISDLYEFLSGEGPWDDGTPTVHEFDAIAEDLAMPSTSIWSKVDGIVNWKSSVLKVNARTENIEVVGASHIGLGGNAAVLWAVADRLAQPEGAFAPFARTGPFAIAYGAGAAR
ncbi:MAG: alpha/beta hydrolase [Candidatus Eremiobacteraeota bacterium]|nr:alpha/beta hydrolase [Candidatus Eremiobacteraeota bacterium]